MTTRSESFRSAPEMKRCHHFPLLLRPLIGKTLLWRSGLLLLTLFTGSGCTDRSTQPEFCPLSYQPSSSSLLVQWDENLHFLVRTIDGEPYTVQFTLDGDSLATGPDFIWRVDRAGPTLILAIARLDKKTVTHQWTTQLDTTLLQTVHTVRLPELYRVPIEGTLEFHWLRPDRSYGQPEMDHYEIALSPKPIPASGPADPTFISIDHRQGVDSYKYTARGLQPGRLYFARIRAVDRIERAGPWSVQLEATPAARFDRSGTVFAVDESHTSFTTIAGVQLSSQDQSCSSAQDGHYTFDGLLDYLPSELRIDPPPSTQLYYFLTPQIESVHDEVTDYLLLPRTTVQMDLPDPTEWSFLKLLRILTSTTNGNSHIAHWEQYPVQVQRFDRVLDNGVDYGASLRRAISLWNEAAGQVVLRAVDGPPLVGAFITASIPPQGGGVLGKVTLVFPADGQLYQTVPTLVHLDLVSSFASQGLADRVILHELGHVLWLTHSPSTNHVMSAGIQSNSPDEIHPDEAAVLRTQIALPNGTRMSWYAEER